MLTDTHVDVMRNSDVIYGNLKYWQSANYAYWWKLCKEVIRCAV